MSRYARRISRPLIAALAVTISIGAAVYYFKNHKPRSAAAHAILPAPVSSPAPNTSQVAPAVAPTFKPGEIKITPSGKPAVSTGLLNCAPQTGLVTQTPTGTSDAGASTPPVSAPLVSAPQPNQSSTIAQQAAPGISITPYKRATAAAPSIDSGNALPISAGSLVDGRKEKEAGHLLSARELINNALLSGQLSDADSDAARQMLTEINQDMLFSTRQIPGDPYTDTYAVQMGERLSRIADRHNVTWQLLLKANGMADAKRIQAGRSIKLINGPFHAVVSKSKFRLDVYLGNPGGPGSMFVMSYPVGLGKDNSTPTGMWIVQQGNKAHPATYFSPRGEGVFAADDPKNPLGGYWMGITGLEGNAVGKSSYGIHGTIEPDTVGKQSSMGCIRLRHDDVAFLYDLLVEGKSKVLVKD